MSKYSVVNISCLHARLRYRCYVLAFFRKLSNILVKEMNGKSFSKKNCFALLITNLVGNNY